MENLKNKKKTLAGMFGQYIFVFIIGTILAAAISWGAVLAALVAPGSIFLPANYGEQMLISSKEKIRAADFVTENLIPPGCFYGVYGQNGDFLYGNFDKNQQKIAWGHYEKDNIYGKGKDYYFFVEKNSGDICIVKYSIAMRYKHEKLNQRFPSPEKLSSWMIFGIFLLLTVLNGFFLARKFARRLKKELVCLSAATAKISANDLEFDVSHSTIREVEEVMASLEKMKLALKESLKNQWDAEQMKHQQLSALAHDIKTPLTVVRGNAELLEEAEIGAEERECAGEILKNTAFIENYLDSMRQVLRGKKEKERREKIRVQDLAKALKEMAEQLATAEKIPVAFSIPVLTDGEYKIICHKEEMLRAWGNLLSNALEHTDWKKGIHVTMVESGEYFVVSVRDYGVGFSEKALLYGAEPFFSGDESRHDRTHQGLGLSIAAEFMKRQGGFLKYENVENEEGAVTALWISRKEFIID